MKEKKIAILVPCYNESKTVAKVVKDFSRALPQAKIYVYDNNSTDGTGEVARRAGAIVRREPRQGKGNVIRTMFREIEADCYLMVDGDNTYSANQAREMCDAILISGADMVIGDRLSSSYFKENKRPFHNTGNRLVSFLINRIFGSHIKDAMSGYRAFSKRFVKVCPVLSRGFEIETEVTIFALDNHFLVEELSVDYKDRIEGYSKLKTMKDGLRVLGTIIRMFEECKPRLFFSILAGFFATLSCFLGIPVVIEFFETGLVLRFPTLITAGFLMLVAILMAVCGIILGVIAKKQRELFEVFIKNEPK